MSKDGDGYRVVARYDEEIEILRESVSKEFDEWNEVKKTAEINEKIANDKQRRL